MEPMTRLRVDTSDFPTASMRQRSMGSRYNVAASKIRSQFTRSLQSLPGKAIRLVNTRDASTPPLSFTFIDGYLYREGVEPPDPSMMQGCGLVPSRFGPTCKPNMGANCGCEYTRSCECLEYARINDARLDVHERQMLRDYEDGAMISLMGLPKRFPYSAKSGLLVSSYLGHRWPIYECNDNCACGPGCKSRVVQKGRTVGLEIFKTKHRGWGLRATENLRQGQFIDTYRGEVITRDEADRRAVRGGKSKDSYLFSLDKFMREGDHRYEIDGEFYGGPTRFINHSCEPNCVVYVVSRDKNNTFLYEIAFFALRDIAAGEELTFDYRDDDGTTDEAGSANETGEGSESGAEEDSIPCLCGAKNCRKWLWK
ncbi:hypothetical protein, variant [Verruconis gallopava]|nr:hypothetical protein, variant [Verruconis gallopava]KIV98894.1 hypothetical protein, variant [Verruconis gallopava]